MLKSPCLKSTSPDKIITKSLQWTSVQELKQSSFEKLLKGKDNNNQKTLNDKKETTKVSVEDMIQPTKAGTTLLKNVHYSCEGLSAKTYALLVYSTGISFTGTDTKKGRDWFGILPLRGKFLNVRNANNDKNDQKYSCDRSC